jgi:hypothetical protein
LVLGGVQVTPLLHYLGILVALAVTFAAVLSIAFGGVMIVMILASSNHHILAALAAMGWIIAMIVGAAALTTLSDNSGCSK